MTNTERIEELEETIQELRDVLEDTQKDKETLEEALDELKEEFQEFIEVSAQNFKELRKLQDHMKRFIDVRYTYDKYHNRDILQVKAHITRDVLEHAGPEALDMAYQNMKDQLTEAMKKPYNYPNNKYNPPSVW